MVAAGILQLGKELLELVRDAEFFFAVDVRVISPAVDRFSKFRCHEEGLDGTVHVACCTLITQPQILTPSLALLQVFYFLTCFFYVFR